MRLRRLMNVRGESLSTKGFPLDLSNTRCWKGINCQIRSDSWWLDWWDRALSLGSFKFCSNLRLLWKGCFRPGDEIMRCAIFIRKKSIFMLAALNDNGVQTLFVKVKSFQYTLPFHDVFYSIEKKRRKTHPDWWSYKHNWYIK